LNGDRRLFRRRTNAVPHQYDDAIKLELLRLCSRSRRRQQGEWDKELPTAE
jgi:hypothetical protein